MNYLTRKKENEIFVHLLSFKHPSKQALYIVKYKGSKSVSDLWNIILNTMKVDGIDGVPFELLKRHSAKQLFLAVDFYTLWSDF